MPPLNTWPPIAQELNSDGNAIEALEKQYLRAQLARACRPESKAVGIDEIWTRNGITYRIGAGNLIRGRPVGWSEDRKQAGDTSIYQACEITRPAERPGWRNSGDIRRRCAGYFDEILILFLWHKTITALIFATK